MSGPTGAVTGAADVTNMAALACEGAYVTSLLAPALGARRRRLRRSGGRDRSALPLDGVASGDEGGSTGEFDVRGIGHL